MPVVRGDRIGESSKLNACSDVAQDFYAAFVAAVPDDFGRFRRSPAHVSIRMYPRREPTVASLGRIARMMDELEAAGLWTTWTVDGVVFGEMVGFKPTGNMYHRTPEPPGSLHRHSKRCGKTAMSRAKEWGDAFEAKRLGNEIKGLGIWKVEGRSKEGRRKVEHPSPPSPSLPSTDTDRQVGARARESSALRPPNPHVDRDALVREGHRLIGEVGLAANLDPTEVIAKASEWKGRSYVRLDVMPDDRLAHTVNALRSWHRRLTGQAEPEARPVSPLDPKLERTAEALRRFVGGST